MKRCKNTKWSILNHSNKWWVHKIITQNNLCPQILHHKCILLEIYKFQINNQFRICGPTLRRQINRYLMLNKCNKLYIANTTGCSNLIIWITSNCNIHNKCIDNKCNKYKISIQTIKIFPNWRTINHWRVLIVQIPILINRQSLQVILLTKLLKFKIINLPNLIPSLKSQKVWVRQRIKASKQKILEIETKNKFKILMKVHHFETVIYRARTSNKPASLHSSRYKHLIRYMGRMSTRISSNIIQFMPSNPTIQFNQCHCSLIRRQIAYISKIRIPWTTITPIKFRHNRWPQQWICRDKIMEANITTATKCLIRGAPNKIKPSRVCSTSNKQIMNLNEWCDYR